MSRATVVCVTRPSTADDALIELLEASGAEVRRRPLLRIAPPDDPAPLLAAARDLFSFDLVAFTSRNAVRGLRDALPSSAALNAADAPAIAAVGPGTARVLEALGAAVRYVPARADAEGLADLLEEELDLVGRRVLLPLGDRARRPLPERREAAGARVTEVCAYRTVPAGPGPAEELVRELLAGAVDAVTFTSGSAVEALVESVGEARARAALGRARVAVIGRTTAAALDRLGVAAPVIAAESRPESLCRAALGRS